MQHSIKDSLCQLGMRPLILTGALRHVLIHLFSNSNHIEEPDLRQYIWRDAENTDILIESVNRWTGNLVEKRPAVLLKRNAYRNTRLLRNDRVGVDGEGFENYSTLWVGSHTLFCIHGTGASCEILATEVQRGLTQFGPPISQQLDLHKFQVVEVGQVSEVEEATENFVIPITVGWAYEETWRVEPESLKLTAIHLDLDAHDD